MAGMAGMLAGATLSIATVVAVAGNIPRSLGDRDELQTVERG
jgi:hypothetical protein